MTRRRFSRLRAPLSCYVTRLLSDCGNVRERFDVHLLIHYQLLFFRIFALYVSCPSLLLTVFFLPCTFRLFFYPPLLGRSVIACSQFFCRSFSILILRRRLISSFFGVRQTAAMPYMHSVLEHFSKRRCLDIRVHLSAGIRNGFGPVNNAKVLASFDSIRVMINSHL